MSAVLMAWRVAMSLPDPHSSDFAETFLLPTTGSDSHPQVEEDVALAVELVGCGLLSDRQLSTLFSNWSIHGTTPLHQHLRDSGLLTPDQLQRLMQNVQRTMERTPRPASDPPPGTTRSESHLAEVLGRFDPSGRLARLLGISTSATGASAELRTATSQYQLIRKLGQGGLGTVWLARDLQLQRLVALKEISPTNEASDARMTRFRQEAEITGRLEHPGIVPVHGLCQDQATGRSFYTMRFLGKSTLQNAIAEYHERREEGNEDPMLLRHLLAAFVNVCNAVAHAHSRKVIHRDLKPENVVIDSYGQVILIDWGLAKVLDDASVERLDEALLTGDGHTADGQVLGTPLYMAPEQAAGRIDEIDQRTDIYGLGAILFAIISGAAPHESSQAKNADSRAGVRGMLSTIASGPTPHAADVHGQVDPALAAICAKAMARKRYARYQTASELAEEVQRWMAGESVSAFQEPTMQKLRRWVGRHQRLSQLLAALLAIVLATGATLAVSARHEYLTQRQSRFEQISADVSEIELQLRTAADNLSRNTRFMATLPPIDGIMQVRATSAGEDEGAWIDQLVTIYSGLLRANPDYLAVSFIAATGSDESNPAGSQEIVRVERSPHDTSYIRAVPRSRLIDLDENPLLAEVTRLAPGEVRLTADDPRQQTPREADVIRVTGCVPIYDDTSGRAFGMVSVETDLIARLKSVLHSLGSIVGDIYITDDTGNVLVSAAAGGADAARSVQSIPSAFAELGPLFKTGEPALTVSDGETYVGRRVRIDAAGRGVAIIARLAQ